MPKCWHPLLTTTTAALLLAGPGLAEEDRVSLEVGHWASCPSPVSLDAEQVRAGSHSLRSCAHIPVR